MNPPSSSHPTPPAGSLPPWPMFRVGAFRHPVNACILPGIQAHDLVLPGNTAQCGITGERVPVGPGIGTLFVHTFMDSTPTAVAASVLRRGHLAIRMQLCHRLILDALEVQRRCRSALDHLQVTRWEDFSHESFQIEGLIRGMVHRAFCLPGVLAIIGGPEDPYLAHLRQRARR